MTVLDQAMARQPVLWWASLVLILLAAVKGLQGSAMLANTTMVLAIFLWGVACAHLVAMVIYRGLLPLWGFSVPRIAHDLSFTALALVWAMCWAG